MIQLKKDNQVINAPIGYSFTTFFFGFFPMLFRGDFAMAGVIFAIGLASLMPVIGLLAIPAFFIIPAVANRIFIARRQAEGYVGGEPVSTAVFPLHQGEGKAIAITVCIFFALAVFFGVLIGVGIAASGY